MSLRERLGNPSGKPDIILIISDQERATQHFPDNWEQDNLKTLTFLKQNGFSFDRAFCNTCMCSPSRSTLLTGLYPAQHHVTQTLTEGGRYSPGEVTLDNTLPNIARVLFDAGYDVQYRGKWHVSKGADGGGPEPSDIAMYGFKSWVAPDAGENTAPENFGGGFANHDKAYVQQAIAYLQSVRERRAKGDMQPYCMVLSLVNPHDVLCYPKDFQYGYNADFLNGPIGLPKTANEDLITQQKPSAQVQVKATAALSLGALNTQEKQTNYINFYGNLLRVIDTEVGFFIDELYKEAEGSRLADQALVIRIADHGEMGMAHGGMRQKAFVTYEEALRIPMVFSNPILFPENTPYKATQNLASLIDILPTIADLIGVAPPEGLRGTSLAPLLEQDKPVQDAILFTFDDTKASAADKASVVKAANRIRSVRTTEWKYSHYFDALGGYPDEYELYDLRQPDALEYENLAYDPAFGEIREKMAQLLEDQIKQKLAIRPESFEQDAFVDWYQRQD
ncbi:sulfatase-like hydrolase/transferase [Taibaiella koreensis]|uniref:sulfatase-like hydrolase/transferase n=1 Tax=Taibaiella koreensis TaxID=1268548 RepID=UPI000E59D280|nr:sulfatase-like hydrolase/transferase [Taibaiella koreensis]